MRAFSWPCLAGAQSHGPEATRDSKRERTQRPAGTAPEEGATGDRCAWGTQIQTDGSDAHSHAAHNSPRRTSPTPLGEGGTDAVQPVRTLAATRRRKECHLSPPQHMRTLKPLRSVERETDAEDRALCDCVYVPRTGKSTATESTSATGGEGMIATDTGCFSG